MQQYEQAFGKAQLLVKHLKGGLNNEEQVELEAWLSADNANRQLLEQLEDNAQLQQELLFFETVDTENALGNVKNQLGEGGKVITMRHSKRRWWYAAAVILLLVGAALIYKLGNKEKAEKQLAQTTDAKTDAAPGGNRAVLTLADGSTILLDSALNGALSQQGNTKVVKLDNGQLAYTTSGVSTEVLYNTVSTPRGGQYQLTLADGSKVWLNAISSLRFPAAFTGKERKVELIGEAYFEIAKNASMPFKVNVAGKGEVEVLGTHFNINSYSDETTINTTLLEGKVKFSALSNQQTLTPGEQAMLNSNGQISVNKNADIDEVMAWKNGLFQFNDRTPLTAVLRQLARWYDVEVVYEKNIPDIKFGGEMKRDLNLSQVLKGLDKLGVNFRIEGKKLIVLP